MYKIGLPSGLPENTFCDLLVQAIRGGVNSVRSLEHKVIVRQVGPAAFFVYDPHHLLEDPCTKADVKHTIRQMAHFLIAQVAITTLWPGEMV